MKKVAGRGKSPELCGGGNATEYADVMEQLFEDGRSRPAAYRADAKLTQAINASTSPTTS